MLCEQIFPNIAHFDYDGQFIDEVELLKAKDKALNDELSDELARYNRIPWSEFEKVAHFKWLETAFDSSYEVGKIFLCDNRIEILVIIKDEIVILTTFHKPAL